MSSVISLENITLRYSRKGPDVLKNVSLEVPKGSFCFLTGHSGAGKSTLLKLMYLAHSQTSGTLKLFGDDVTKIPKAKMPFLRRKIGVVFQEYGLINHLSAFDNVALPLRIAGYKEKEVKEYVTDLLDWVGLKDFINSKPTVLSGGQQQRISIARAVINRPSILLADEPTGNVDDDLAVRLLRLFEELNRSGTTIIIATHSEWLVKRFNKYPRLHINEGKLTVIAPNTTPPRGNTSQNTTQTQSQTQVQAQAQSQVQSQSQNQTPQQQTTQQPPKSALNLEIDMKRQLPPVQQQATYAPQGNVSPAYNNVEEELLQGNQNLELSLKKNIKQGTR